MIIVAEEGLFFIYGYGRSQSMSEDVTNVMSYLTGETLFNTHRHWNNNTGLWDIADLHLAIKME